MKPSLRYLLFTLLALGLTAPAASAQTCEPWGAFCLSGRCYFDYIANGTPDSDTCWSHSASYVTGVTTCGSPANAFEFTYQGRTVHQTIAVPSDMPYTGWSLSWELDFIDPNNDGSWNWFKAEVWDDTTGTRLASYHTDGRYADQYCARRDLSFSGNFAGHTLSVRFTGQSAYPDTHIRVRNIALFQELN